MSPQTPLARTIVRCLFAALLISCVFQYAVVQVLGEPYPAILMPGFPGSGGYQNGAVKTKRLEAVFIPAQGEPVTFSQRELLSEFPDSLHNTIAESFLTPLPEDQDFEETPSTRTGIRYRLFPGLEAGHVDRTSAANIASLTSWLQDRAHRLLPGQSVAKVEIRWFEDSYQTRNGELTSARMPAGSFVVHLGEVKP
jgi:hypothetical protein